MGLLRLAYDAVRAVRGKETESNEALRLLHETVACGNDEIAKLRQESARWERIAKENHDVIVSVLKERDQWAEMWRQHGVEHAGAQAFMQEIIERAHKEIALLLDMVNEQRDKDSQPHLASQFVTSVEAAKKIAEDYKKSLAAGAATVKPVDALADRDAVAARNPLP